MWWKGLTHSSHCSVSAVGIAVDGLIKQIHPPEVMSGFTGINLHS